MELIKHLPISDIDKSNQIKHVDTK